MKNPLLIITLLLCTAVSFSQTPQQGEIDYVFTAGDINYKITSIAPDNVEVINSPLATGDIIIPETVDDGAVTYSVTAIGDYAFYDSTLTSVDIPDNVTVIRDRAFFSNQLTTVKIPDNVTIIENYAFYENQLKTVDIGENVTTIDAYAFYNNALTSVNIPDGLIAIGNHAFGANALTTVEIPENVTHIGESAFLDNPLISVVLKSLTPPSIGADTFENRNGITLTVPAGTKTDYENNGWTGFLDIIEASTLGINDIALNDADVALLITDNQLKVATGASQLKHYKIYSITGANVLNGSQNAVSIAHLSHGVYVAVLTLDSGVISKKFAK